VGQRAHDHHPDHVRTAARLREAFQQPRATLLTARATSEPEVVLRDLADYDAAFGVDLAIDHRPDISPGVGSGMEVAS
jgi:glyoxylase-like metal-dependent hydrolase (beta-lactamase superfamily II)